MPVRENIFFFSYRDVASSLFIAGELRRAETAVEFILLASWSGGIRLSQVIERSTLDAVFTRTSLRHHNGV